MLRKLFGSADHPHHHNHAYEETGQLKLRAAAISIGVNLFLIVVKLAVALTTGSLGLLAEVGHSSMDLAASGFAYWGIKLGSRPPDVHYHYGHEKYENLSSAVQMALLAGICLFIFYEVYRRLAYGFVLQVTNVAIGVMVASIVIDFVTARFLHQQAHTHGSSALEADAYHFTADLWSSIAVMVGLVAAHFGYSVVDPISAAVVGVVMLIAAVRVGGKTTRVLLDAAPDGGVEKEVRAILQAYRPEITFHSLRMRQAGSGIYLDLSLHVPSKMSVIEAHEAAHRLTREIKLKMPQVRDALIHVEPAESHDELDEDHPNYTIE